MSITMRTGLIAFLCLAAFLRLPAQSLTMPHIEDFSDGVPSNWRVDWWPDSLAWTAAQGTIRLQVPTYMQTQSYLWMPPIQLGNAVDPAMKIRVRFDGADADCVIGIFVFEGENASAFYYLTTYTMQMDSCTNGENTSPDGVWTEFILRLTPHAEMYLWLQSWAYGNLGTITIDEMQFGEYAVLSQPNSHEILTTTFWYSLPEHALRIRNLKGGFRCAISDMTGRTVDEFSGMQDAVHSTEKLTPGIYVARLKGLDGIDVLKFQVQ